MIKYRKYLAAFLTAAFLVFSVQRAHAFFDETGQYLPLLAPMTAGSAALITGGTVLGLGPVGWGAVGLSLLASVLLTSDTKSKIIVSSQDINSDPNPDLSTEPSVQVAASSPPTGGLKGDVHVTNHPFLYFNDTVDFLNSSNSAEHNSLFEKTKLQLETYGFYVTRSPDSSFISILRSPDASKCPRGLCLKFTLMRADTLGTCPTALGFTCTFYTSTIDFYLPLTVGTGRDCPVGSSMSWSLGSCLSPKINTQTLSDGICRVSWTSSGCPVRNPNDPDCPATLKLSCGTTTVAPSVTYADSSGLELIAQRPALSAQGSVGTFTVKERKPNPTTSTTDEKITTASAPSPGQAPTVVSATQQSYAGVGSAASATPLSKVAVSNWPDTMNVNCLNCNNNQTPSEVKIDTDVPDGADELPDFANVPDHRGFLDPVKQRLAGFMSFELPPHASQCPAIQIEWSAWNLNINQSSNYMCELLESNRDIISGLVTFVYIASAIMILLGA